MNLLSRVIGLWALAYGAFLLFFACRNDFSNYNIVARTSCIQLNYVVYPMWDRYIHPLLTNVDEKFGISELINPKLETCHLQWIAFDEKHRLSYKLDLWWTSVQVWANRNIGRIQAMLHLRALYYIAKVQLMYEGKKPMIMYQWETCRSRSSRVVGFLSTKARLNISLFLRASKRHAQRSLELYIGPSLRTITKRIHANAHVQKILATTQVQWFFKHVKLLVSSLMDKSSHFSNTMQQKTDFLRSEVYNLTRSDRLKQRLKGNLLETRVMQSPEIIRNTTQEFENSDSDESDTEIEYITVTQTSTVTIVEEETKSPSIESHNKIEPNSEEETNGSSIESHDISAEPKAEKESKSYTVEPHNNIAVPKIEDDNVEAYGLLSPKAQVEQEIEYWRNKVLKMIDLSQSSLETELKPFLDTIIGDLKDRISANFTKLQQENYLRYKVMAEMISSIDKDSETLITTKEIILSPEVDRQMMRDRILEAREAVENSMKDVELVLNEAHGIIMEKYFEVAQNTIDVLESFADTKILEFSNSLSGLLTILENNVDFEDEISWNAWKEFHKIKELIFNARDKILDEAHTYKLQPRGSIKPRALEPWALYLDNINFHIRFLLSDNDDYLKLVRAKANVAYQMREGLTRQLEEIQEQAAQEKAAQEKAEQEKAEQEQAAQEKAEQEKAEQDAQEKAEQEKSEQENLEQENLEQEKAEREEAEREKAEREEAEREKAVQQETPQEKAAQQEEEEQKKSNNPGLSTSIAMSVESSNKETDSVSDIGSATLEAIAVNTQVPEAIAQLFLELSKEEDNTDAENIPEVTCSPILETATVSSPSQSTHSEAENQILGAHDQLDVSNSADYEPIEADEYLEAGEADEAF